MLLKTWLKTLKRWGIYSPNTKLAVRAELAALTGSGRSPGRPPMVINVTDGQTRSTARSTQTNRELCSQIRSTGPVPARRAQVCARRSTPRVDRPMVRSTVQVDRPGLSVTEQGQKNWEKYFNKSFIFSKNPQK